MDLFCRQSISSSQQPKALTCSLLAWGYRAHAGPRQVSFFALSASGQHDDLTVAAHFHRFASEDIPYGKKRMSRSTVRVTSLNQATRMNLSVSMVCWISGLQAAIGLLARARVNTALRTLKRPPCVYPPAFPSIRALVLTRHSQGQDP